MLGLSRGKLEACSSFRGYLQLTAGELSLTLPITASSSALRAPFINVSQKLSSRDGFEIVENESGWRKLEYAENIRSQKRRAGLRRWSRFFSSHNIQPIICVVLSNAIEDAISGLLPAMHMMQHSVYSLVRMSGTLAAPCLPHLANFELQSFRLGRISLSWSIIFLTLCFPLTSFWSGTCLGLGPSRERLLA